jgi:hypothetical protein
VKHAIQRPALDSFDKRMNMIRHHAPCQQPVSLPVEMEQGIFHQSSDAWLPKQTFIMASIEVIFDSPAKFRCDLVFGISPGSASVPLA